MQLVRIVNLFFEILTWMIFARVILSWIPHNPNNSVTRLLYEGTEPILSPFRKLMPKSGLPIDFSPILALFMLRFIQKLLIEMLYRL